MNSSYQKEKGIASLMAKWLVIILEILLIIVYLVGGFSFLRVAPSNPQLQWGYLAVGIFLMMQALFGRYSALQFIRDLIFRDDDTNTNKAES